MRKCEIYILGPFSVAVWTPKLGLGIAEKGHPRRYTFHVLWQEFLTPWTWRYIPPKQT